MPSQVAPHAPSRARGAAATALFLACTLGLVAATQAAPRRPADDSQVLERLQQRRDSPQQRELRALREQLRAAPADPAAAVALAQKLYDIWAADGDPRHLGHAQAALAPWWQQADASVEVRVMRAVLKQVNHDFDTALLDLQAAVQEDADHVPAWAWMAAVNMVQANYPAARQACAQLLRLQVDLVARACAAQVDATTGAADAAQLALQQALASHPKADADERLWVLTRLAETQALLGQHEQAEASFRSALALNLPDGYLQAAYADFLLERGRASEVLVLLKDTTRSDTLMLRLAIAARQSQAANAATLAAAMAARFDAARERGDTTHRKEEARFWLDVSPNPARALPLAVANFAQQREPADVRLLMQAALAANDAAAAEPALRWMREARHQGLALVALAQRLREAAAAVPATPVRKP